MIHLFFFSLLVRLTYASSCGDSLIPYSLEILPDGQPILGCARPTCFGWAPSGQPATISGSFQTINGRQDGFIRPGFNSVPEYGPDDDRFYRPQTAVCEPAFTSTRCSGRNQWVGGIAPQLNLTNFPTMLQCCTFDGLLHSEDRGIATVHAGQMVVGGEIVTSGIQVGFDYISDVLRVVRDDGSLQYKVSFRRMPCAHPHGSAGSSKTRKTGGSGAQAYQAATVTVDEPLPLSPASSATPEFGVLEEIVREEAIQLPPGTQFQPVPQPPSTLPLPPPPQQPVVLQAPQFVPQYQPVAAPPQYYAPVAYSGGGAAGFCFTGDMTVRLMDGSTKRMDELKKNDWVLSANKNRLEYVPVKFWLHRVPTQEAVFNVFETEDGKTIKLTDKHYIFKGDCNRVGKGPVAIKSLPKSAVTADQLSKGDCIFTLVANGKRLHEVRIIRAGKITQTGFYAPMTSTGRIIVNGVHASCHNVMQANAMGQSVYWLVEKVNEIYDSLFGSDPDEVVETPTGLSTILAVYDMVLPKNLVTF